MSFSVVLSEQWRGMCVISWPYHCPWGALSIVLSTAWAVHQLRYAPAISDSLFSWLGIVGELFYVFTSNYKKVIRDNSARWIEYNGIVPMMLKWRAEGLQGRNYMQFLLWSVNYQVSMVHGTHALVFASCLGACGRFGWIPVKNSLICHACEGFPTGAKRKLSVTFACAGL